MTITRAVGSNCHANEPGSLDWRSEAQFGTPVGPATALPYKKSQKWDGCHEVHPDPARLLYSPLLQGNYFLLPPVRLSVAIACFVLFSLGFCCLFLMHVSASGCLYMLCPVFAPCLFSPFDVFHTLFCPVLSQNPTTTLILM